MSDQKNALPPAKLSLPADAPAGMCVQPRLPAIKAEKPETPEPLEEPSYIYRTADPFRYAIDEARAVASISRAHPRWVRRAWFALFVILPVLTATLWIASLFSGPQAEALALEEVAGLCVAIAVWGMYLSIWFRRVEDAEQR